MTKEELRKQFETETGEPYMRPNFFANLAYVLWLESRLANDGKYSGEKVVELCRDELLKQMHPMMHVNEYPCQAVPQATILALPALMKSHLTAAPSKEGGANE